MKIWQNSVYAPNRPSKSKRSKKRAGGKSFAKMNRKGGSKRKHRKVRANGRTLASYNKKRKRVRSNGHNSGHSITLANKGEMLPVQTMLIAGVGGAGLAGVAIFLGEKYLVPKMTFLDAKAGAAAADVAKDAQYKSAALGGIVAVSAGYGAVKIKHKQVRLALLGASLVGIAYALNELFGKAVKDAVTGTKSTGGMFVFPAQSRGATGSINLATVQARALGGMTVQVPAMGGMTVQVPAMGSTIGNDYNKRVW